MAPHHSPRRALRVPVGIASALVAGALAVACTSTGGTAAPTTTSTSTSTTSTTVLDPGPGPTSLEGVSARLQTIVGARPETPPTTRPGDIEVTYLDAPTAMAPRPGRNQMWVAERGGRVRIITRDASYDKGAGATERGGYNLLPGNVLDLSSMTTDEGERGLLGLAFSSDGRTLYVDHTLPDGDITVASYRITDKTPFNGGTGGEAPPADTVATVDPQSRQVLLTIPHQDQSNHNGGNLVIGPDGYLYIGVGDGGGSGDPNGNAQDPDTWLGKILRIDAAIPIVGAPYAIPADNPFAGGGGKLEIYLWGVRNPWRFSFDRATGDLWVADVGQEDVEEIDRLPAASGAGRGANLGWNWFEGDQRYRKDGTPPEGTVPPLHTYTHAQGCSITGGYVYRGPDVPDLDGTYVYGDYCTGEIRGLLSRRGIVLDDRPLGIGVPENQLVSFAEGEQGELYVLSADGTLSKVVS